MYVVLKVHEKSKGAVDHKGLQFFYCSNEYIKRKRMRDLRIWRILFLYNRKDRLRRSLELRNARVEAGMANR